MAIAQHAASAPASAAVARQAASESLFSAQTIERVRAIAREKGDLMAGRVTFFGMDRLRAHYGESWPQHADRAFSTVKQLLEHRLGEKDVCQRVGSQGFLLVLADNSIEGARAKCAALTKAITDKLLGDQSLGTFLSVDSSVQAISSKLLLASMTEQTETPEAPAAAPTKPGAAANAQTAPAAAPEAAPRPQFVFRPIWNVKAKVISAYQGWPSVPPRTDARPARGAIEERERATFGLDRNLLEYAVSKFDDPQGAPAPRLTIVPVHVSSLDNLSDRRRYLEICHAVPEFKRKRLVFEVLGMPKDVAKDAMGKYSASLRQVGGALIARMEANRARFDTLAETGYMAVSADVRNIPGPEAEVFAWMDRFVRGASLARLRTFLHGINSVSLAVAAVCSGFDYIDGDAVRPIIDEPGGIAPYEAADLFTAYGS
jgi:GGDEF domain-containing protein